MPFSRMKPRIIAVVGLRPDDEHVGDRRVGDPHLAADEADSRRARVRARVTIEPGSEPWLGSVRPKQPIHSPVASFGRYFLRCASRAVRVDRVHHERALHAHHRAVAGVDALDLARDQAVADVVEPGAAVLRRQRRAEEPERAHLAEDRRIRLLVAKRLGHARQELVLRVGVRGVAHHPLFLGQLLVEQQRVVPREFRLGLGLDAFGGIHGELQVAVAKSRGSTQR